jgi:hypothetical protein
LVKEIDGRVYPVHGASAPNEAYDVPELSRFNIPGRGLVIATENPVECDDFNHLKFVSISGAKYKVVAVEACGHAKPFKAGERINLNLVELV